MLQAENIARHQPFTEYVHSMCEAKEMLNKKLHGTVPF